MISYLGALSRMVSCQCVSVFLRYMIMTGEVVMLFLVLDRYKTEDDPALLNSLLEAFNKFILVSSSVFYPNEGCGSSLLIVILLGDEDCSGFSSC